MKLWRFRTKNFEVTCFIEKDTFDGSYMEADLVKECRDKIRAGEWKCFQTTVRVKHRPSGEILAESYLGNSIYADPRDFIDHRGMNKRNYGSYFSGMVREACQEARAVMVEKRKAAHSTLDNLEQGRVKEVSES